MSPGVLTMHMTQTKPVTDSYVLHTYHASGRKDAVAIVVKMS